MAETGANPAGMSAVLPTGTITFLLTDIEKSTALWEAYGEDMARAVERHETIISSSTERHGGIVVRSKGEGDSCFCVFTRAPDAVAAALEIQLVLGSEPWSGPRIAVRMALHTGAAELRDGQYYGTVVNRCARLRGAGHGGQTLLSSATRALVQEAVPPRATLKDLGPQRLPDLAQPERVYQLCHSHLTDDFPALASLDAYPNNLPVRLTRFVGREEELATIKHVLSRHRLVTITGPGGCGKTRLSQQAAAELLGDFPDGVWLIGLASFEDPALVVAQLASTLGVREEANREFVHTVVDYLREKRALLLLDNCEHVLHAAADVAANVLALCRNIKLIATSRQALGIEGELARPLRPLSVPPGGTVSAEELLAYEGVQLLSDRAGHARPGFTVNDHNASAVAEICRRLDGIPLAIELAAARLGALGPAELARRLDDRFRLLAGARRGGPPRHETLEAAVDWSYELCDDAERLLFRRLAVFAGHFPLDAVESVCAGDGLDRADVAGLLMGLVERSLVYADAEDETVTYRMLQTIRAVALAKLEASGEEPTMRSRHFDRFLAIAQEAEENLLGADQARWLALLEALHDDIRAALSWSVFTDPSRALHLAATMAIFWDARGHWTEGRRWLDAALDVASASDPHLPAALARAGNLAFEQGDYAAARRRLERGLALRRQLGDDAGAAHALSLLVHVDITTGDVTAARDPFEEAIELSRVPGQSRPVGVAINLALAAQALGHPLAEDLYREALVQARRQGHKRGIAGALVGLGNLARSQGDLRAARQLHEEALPVFRELRDRFGTAEALSSLAAIVRSAGDESEASELLRQALPLYRELGDRRGTGRTLIRLGVDVTAAEDEEKARELLSEALQICRELEDAQGIAASLTYLARAARRAGEDGRAASLLREAIEWCGRLGGHRTTATCLEELAGLAVAAQPERATTLLGAAEALREAVAATGRSGQANYERDVAVLRSSLDEDRFTRAWKAGRAMSPADAVAFARAG